MENGWPLDGLKTFVTVLNNTLLSLLAGTNLVDRRPEPARIVIGIYYWDANRPLIIDRPLAQLDLNGNLRYLAFDFWSKQLKDPTNYRSSHVVKDDPYVLRIWSPAESWSPIAVLGIGSRPMPKNASAT